MIDRHEVVQRHAMTRDRADRLNPITVGNGDFAFTADITGLQSFPEFHDPRPGADGVVGTPLATMAQWAFHESPNPHGWTLVDVMRPYRTRTGRTVSYPTAFDFERADDELDPEEEPGDWLWLNPHRFDLGRLGFEFRRNPQSAPLGIESVTSVAQRLDLWSGVLHSEFVVLDERVSVTTVVHPKLDVVAVRVSSRLLGEGRAMLVLRFAAPAASFGRTVDWERTDRHTSGCSRDGDIVRIARHLLPGTAYQVAVLAPASWEQRATHEFALRFDHDQAELTLGFSPGADHAMPPPDFTAVLQASTDSWSRFWSRGAAVDLSGSADPRWHELERRVVHSQYILATQAAGQYPSQETGLVMNSWAGKFHLEMHWWHAAQFALWGRPELLERSFAWYLGILPQARRIAHVQGYDGARWPKHVGPFGRESPNLIGPLLFWQQPHPIHLAELIRLTSPEPRMAVERYAEIVEDTARFIASFLDVDGETVHLGPPIMPAQERYDPAVVSDPAFELAYAGWALGVAQEWRELRGLAPEPRWAWLREGLADLPVDPGGTYAAVRGAATLRADHPSMLFGLGLVPPTPAVDRSIMNATLDSVLADWDWETAWGWDYGALAMCACRLGRQELAYEILLCEQEKNRWLDSGHNFQVPGALPLYLPGNGALLAAVALLAACGRGAAGWQLEAEGFDGIRDYAGLMP